MGAVATITFSVTVNNPDTGDKVLAQTVTSATAGSNCAAGSTDTRCSVTVVVLVPGLTIVQTGEPGDGGAGGDRGLHGDGDQLGADGVYGGDVH